MKILVTGGAGFIGHHLILRLRADGHEVETVDNISDYYDPTLKEARLKRFDEGVKVHRVDITDRDALEAVFKAGKFDAICHLAAQAGVRYSLEHPDVYVATNYIGSFNVLDLSKKYEVPQVVMASTSSVYGTSTEMPFTEENLAQIPMSIYAATKRGMEFMGANYSHLYDMNVTALRFFTVYGPWGRPDMALFIFTKKMLAGEPIDVFNNGDMRRDFTYVDDIVDGFTKAVERPQKFEVINLGNGKPVHLMDFIKILEQELGTKAKINFKPLQPGDVPETYANVGKAKELLGYESKVDVEEGVKNFVAWYKQHYLS